ncbi:MAG: ankyrin repeat domain-containing protein [Leptospiraceae bacterium]|nr:ankyrin repeat domain-containing protein [Leptospiraceae bacterium]MBL0266158.1 ankyrin repeat domain-containing protein [Leptospiraceae bacterium]
MVHLKKGILVFCVIFFISLSCNRFLNNNKVHSRENTNKEEELFLEAFFSKDYNKMKSLIDAGININAIKAGYETLIELSTTGCDTNTTEFLISNGATVEFGYHGKEVSDLVYFCKPDMIVLLLRHGAKIEIWKYIRKELDERYDSVIINYLASFGQSIKEEISLYKTPLIKAVHFRNLNRVRLLLYLGSSLDVQDAHGRNALQIAVDNHRYDAAEEIIQFRKDDSTERKMKALNFYRGDFSDKFFSYEIDFPEYTIGKTEESDLTNVKSNQRLRISFPEKREIILPNKKIHFDRVYQFYYSSDRLTPKTEASKYMSYFFLGGILQYVHIFSLYPKDIKCRHTDCGFKDCDYPDTWPGQKKDFEYYDSKKLSAFKD